MVFSREEILFFTVVAEGPMPFGIRLPLLKEGDGAACKERVLKALKKKGIVAEDNQFTESGIAALMLWEAYRNNRNHVIFNKYLIAVMPDRRLIVISPEREGYRLQSMDAAVLLYQILRKCPFARQADREMRFAPRQMDYETWHKRFTTFGENHMLVGSFRDGKAEENVFYWKEGHGFYYNFEKAFEIEMQPRRMRTFLMGILGIEGNKKGGDSHECRREKSAVL